MNSQHYCHMIETLLRPALGNHLGYNNRTWFQRHGATFPRKIISILYSPRSLDLILPGFFLLVHLKKKVNNPPTLNMPQLKTTIERKLSQIASEVCFRVLMSMRHYLEETVLVKNRHLDNVIFIT